MSKRKYKKGHLVTNVADLADHKWFILILGPRSRTVHREVIRSWQLRTIDRFLSTKSIYIADPVT